jgi:arginyl-tRNA synthetase
VEREYYFNDGGGQVQRLGASVRARARGEALPEDGYQGDYVAELAELIPDAAERDVADVARAAVAILIERIRATLERYRVHFDHWFLEATLYAGDPSPWDRARATLAEQGRSYESEGALWLRTTELAATTRTACSCAPRASRPTSPPTSPTTGTSSTAASTASSTCSAPTTTATWPA